MFASMQHPSHEMSDAIDLDDSSASESDASGDIIDLDDDFESQDMPDDEMEGGNETEDSIEYEAESDDDQIDPIGAEESGVGSGQS